MSDDDRDRLIGYVILSLIIAAMCCISVLLAFGPFVCWRIAPSFVLVACAIAYLDTNG